MELIAVQQRNGPESGPARGAWVRLSCLALLACTLVGCSTLRAYDGPARTRAEVARLKPAILPRRQILIQSIDGLELNPLQDRVEMLPGSHVIEIAVTLQSQVEHAFFLHTLEFSAQAGRDYTLLAEVDLYGPRSFIIDEHNGHVVAEEVTHSAAR